ncbi:ABC-three component system protein [Alloscardovia sp. HMSC034E08]|uniref:ABC-three component system protein n=1 Tax=Alloscardovia sp. HMSC034E08 TaxID=1739413 RepID=UPI00359F2DD7
MKALSRKLVAKGYSPARVHNDLTERLSQVTKQDCRFCAFIVSYFVRSCGVLDASA